MSKPTLGRARGLNSIADPSDFKGTRGRFPLDHEPENDDPARDGDRGNGIDDRSPDGGEQDSAADRKSGTVSARHGARRVDSRANHSPTSASTDFDSPRGRRSRPDSAAGHRTRRELSVPIPVSDAVEATGINPADVVMGAYRKHSDAVYTGTGGRLVSRGRRRLRLSLTDGDYDKITRLGDARGWNRSETVAVLLAMELLDDQLYSMP